MPIYLELYILSILYLLICYKQTPSINHMLYNISNAYYKTCDKLVRLFLKMLSLCYKTLFNSKIN